MVIGSAELLPLTDAVGNLGALDELYPGVPEPAWGPFRRLYPGLFAGDAWRVPFTCYLLRADGRTVLVDTGGGPPGLWDWEPSGRAASCRHWVRTASSRRTWTSS